MDKPLVSVIIPTKNSEEFLENCLLSIKSQTYQNIEIIVVDNNSTDNTKEIARKFTNKVFNKGPERSAQRNYGASKSYGNYILIIDSDMVLSKKVIISCLEKIETNKDIKAIIIPEESFGEGFWAKCKALERSFYLGVDWIEAARFFDKRIFLKFHGYDLKNTGTEDYDLPQRIKEQYGDNSIGRIQAKIYHNEHKISLIKCCQKKFHYAKNLEQYLEKTANKKNFAKQVSISKRYKLFLSNPKKLFKNPITGLGALILKTCEFCSGGIGYIFYKKNER